MKTTLLTLFLALSFLQINAQCSENASSFGNNTSDASYNVSGDVNLTLNTNNTITLNLGSNFRTANGPDVRAYLVNSEGRTSSEIKAITKNKDNGLLIYFDGDDDNDNDVFVDNFQFGLVSASGSQNFTVEIPEGKDITNYDTIFFFCLDFGVFWDFGTFTSFNQDNCSVLSTESIQLNTINIYPNPAKDKIQISNIDAISTEIRIFNVLGKQVFHQPKIASKTIDISSFEKGIYLVKIDADGKSKTQKLVIQ